MEDYIMRKKSANKIIEKYNSYGQRKNSFYEEEEAVNHSRQTLDGGYSNPTITYYLDHTSGELKAKNITLPR